MSLKNEDFRVNFIGVGAARAGTSWISYCLAEHPQICFSKVKETNFFRHGIKEGLSYYQSFFKNCNDEQIKGEFSPNYIDNKKVAILIKKHYPEVKLIFCLRNPIERAYSNYFLSKSLATENSKTFEAALMKKPERYIEKGMYYNKIREYLILFPKKNILIMIYEDISKNPKKFMQEIYSFLGVDLSFTPKSLTRKINPSAKSKYVIHFINEMNLVRLSKFLKKSYAGKSLIKTAKTLKINRLISFIIKKNFKLHLDLSLKPIQKPPMKKRIREYLRGIYKKDIQNLEELLEKDLTSWK